MYSTTLRGVFPEPKPVYRRNFIKENVKSIKQMQGILQEAGVIQPRRRLTRARSINTPLKTKSRESATGRSTGNINQLTDGRNVNKTVTVPNIKQQLSKVAKVKQFRKKDPQSTNANVVEEDRLTNRGTQTEREDNLSHLYETGVIKYPSSGISGPTIKKAVQTGQGDDGVENLAEGIENLGMEDKDFIKENRNIKVKPTKQSPVKVLAQAPPNYQRGVVPKYLRERKDDQSEEIDTECPPGHILLPEDERKETLRVLRQSYADRIQELNMMPVRNDTLRMKKRKMEIEEELKRIDGGIKVFQRPKVYVKINA
ncbi:hypothetical protein ABEB36_010029 [Hypothenemus hampei]|uniref:Enkurin domain-containing protein n=1 Tax=Hypothenemus hampei TaxID=57062 RepID=A0ABD1EIA0_HYPHA